MTKLFNVFLTYLYSLANYSKIFSEILKLIPKVVVKEVREIETARIYILNDKIHLEYNPDFIVSFKGNFFFFIFLHELLHIYLGHCFLDKDVVVAKNPKADDKKFNIAMDSEVNAVIECMVYRNNEPLLGKFFKKNKEAYEAFRSFGIFYNEWTRQPMSFWWYLNDEANASRSAASQENINKKCEKLEHDFNPSKMKEIEKEFGITDINGYEIGIPPTLETLIDNITNLLRKWLKAKMPKAVQKLGHVWDTALGYRDDYVPMSSNKKSFGIKLCFMIDISGSMEMETIQKAISRCADVWKKYDKVFLALVDTRIKYEIELKKLSQLNDLKFTGGGTDFGHCIYDIAKRRNITNFVIYTDGLFNPIKPEGLNIVYLITSNMDLETYGSPKIKCHLE